MKNNGKGLKKAGKGLSDGQIKEKDNTKYTVVRNNVESAVGTSFLTKIMDDFTLKNIEPGQFFIAKRSMKREHNEVGYDYAGMVISPALIKDYYITRIKAWQSFSIGFVALSLFIALISFYIVDGSPVLFFNMNNYSAQIQDFLPSTIVLLVAFNTFRILYMVVEAINSTRWNKVQQFWSSIAFLIADKNDSNTPFKDLLVRWDYVNENFINDVAAESFDKYINGLSEESFMKIVKDGITLSVIAENEEYLTQHPVLMELVDEAQENGNKIRQSILENFNRDFKKL